MQYYTLICREKGSGDVEAMVIRFGNPLQHRYSVESICVKDENFIVLNSHQKIYDPEICQ